MQNGDLVEVTKGYYKGMRGTIAKIQTSLCGKKLFIVQFSSGWSISRFEDELKKIDKN